MWMNAFSCSTDFGRPEIGSFSTPSEYHLLTRSELLKNDSSLLARVARPHAIESSPHSCLSPSARPPRSAGSTPSSRPGSRARTSRTGSGPARTAAPRDRRAPYATAPRKGKVRGRRRLVRLGQAPHVGQRAQVAHALLALDVEALDAALGRRDGAGDREHRRRHRADDSLGRARGVEVVGRHAADAVEELHRLPDDLGREDVASPSR